MTTNDAAEKVAAKATGLRPDQIRAAVENYREAAMAIGSEPEWRAQTHISGPGIGLAQYVSDDTKVTLQVESWKERGEHKSHTYYVFEDRPYELFSEARQVELLAETRSKPHAV